jgi:membrane carboxypeptidase/penicillin-binding protein PbpC
VYRSGGGDEAMEVRTINSSPAIPMRLPHWVVYIRAAGRSSMRGNLPLRFSVYLAGSHLQGIAEQAVSQRVAELSLNADGALIALRPSTGEILAMVGSADFYSEAISGQVNMSISPRQPGSAIKPITYLAAFEKGWTPATVIWDVPSEFPPSGKADDPSPVYKPVNYDGRFHGPISVRTALANSYNVPAVKTLRFVGIY